MTLQNLNWKLFLFGFAKIPAIGFCRPKVTAISEKAISVKIPLRRKTRNHVGSMYLGVMTVGADLASGFLAFYLLELRGLKAAPVFKSMQAEYFKRAEDDVNFVCGDGDRIAEMLDKMEQTKERVNRMVVVSAMCNNDEVARFTMELSMKLRS